MIRPATAGDVAGLAAINAEVQALHLAAMPERYRDPAPAEIEARFVELFADPAVTILAADDAGVLVGYAVVRRLDFAGHTFARPRLTAHLDQLGVRADARRGGHGRALMQAVEELARSWGAAAITLEVQAFNAGARGFYEALGYAPVTTKLGKTL